MVKFKLIYLVLFIGVLLPCKATTPSVVQTIPTLSVFSGMPKAFSYVAENGEAYSRNLIEIWGYPSNSVDKLPELPEAEKLSKEGKTMKVRKDSIESLIEISADENYTVFISGGLIEDFALFGEDGLPLKPESTFQHLNPTEFDFIEASIYHIRGLNEVSEEMVLVDMDDFSDLEDDLMCYLCIIELDENDKILYSTNVVFPCFNGLGSVFTKEPFAKTSKVYIKVILEGEIGLMFDTTESNRFITM